MRYKKVVSKRAEARRAAKGRDQQQRDEFERRLMELAPEECRGFVRRDFIVEVLLVSGQYDARYLNDREKLAHFGCTSRTNLLMKLRALKRAWTGVVEMRLCLIFESGKIEVAFTCL